MTRRRRVFTEAERDVMVARYEEGEGLISIAKDFSLAISTLSIKLREWGVELRSSGRPRGLTPLKGGWELMGTVPDGELATKLGVSRQAVSQKRARYGIPIFMKGDE